MKFKSELSIILILKNFIDLNISLIFQCLLAFFHLTCFLGVTMV